MERDPWIPLDISWEVDRGPQPFYLMISGASGGYLELKIHPEGGELLGLTVIDLPPEGHTLKRAEQPEVIADVVPVFDISGWANVDPSIRVVRASVKLTHIHMPEGEMLAFGEVAAAVEASCGPVVVGVSHQGDLTHFLVKDDR